MNIGNLVRHLSNIPGWSTQRKIIVIESDDWGSIRMPSKEAFVAMIKGGIEIGSNRYNKFDSLESNDDLENLFDVISRYKDKKNNHPVFTALCIVANPDFEKIQEGNFENYYYEPVSETIQHFSRHSNVLDLWREGSTRRLFVPQFHGREHLNVQRWLRDLKLGNKHTMLGFQNKLWGINSKLITEGYQAAFDLDYPGDLYYMEAVIKEGLDLFTKIMGYKARYFVPPNGPFNLNLEKVLHDNGIQYITINKKHKEPLGNNRYRTHYHFPGKKNTFGQIYLSRNVEFEPSIENVDWVDKCLKDIEIAFRMRKPAIISTHRVNFTGSLDPMNRDRGLKQLSELFAKMLKKWPEVEFLSSIELGDLISNRVLS